MGDVPAPTQIDRYKVIRTISKGASGVVFLVESEGKQFALKHLKASDEDTVRRFRKESSTLARISHENLVKIFDVGEYKSAPYMIMDYLEGDALSQVLATHPSGLEVQTAVKATIAVAEALAELHKHNLVHRDIKPANILVTSDGAIKLIDFGLVGDVDQIVTERALVGTPVYCSPEQTMVLKRPVDFRSDLYSLGVTFFESVCGQLPFTGSISEILQKHAGTAAPDIRQIKSQTPASIALVLKKLLAKDPDDRYQSASGLVYDLNRWQEFDSILEKGQALELGSQDRKTLTVRTKYVQRVAEAKQLQECWASVTAGNAGIVIVEGPSGSGKSRLSEEFLQSIPEKDVLILRGKCQFFDADLPFAPIREALDGLFEDISSLPEAARNSYLSKLRESTRGAEPFLPHLTSSFKKIISGIESNTETDLNSGDKKAVFFTNISNFFLNLCREWTAVVILIDDMQWLDQSTLALLNQIFDAGKNLPLLLLGTARDDDASVKHMTTVNKSVGDFVSRRIHVDRFTKGQMEALIVNYLGSAELNPKITEVLDSRSNGNPFVAIEFLRSGIEQGFVFFKDNFWGLNEKNLEKIALAENVYQMILKRVENSSQEAKEILRFAALLGGVFKGGDLSKIKGIAPEQMEVILRDIQDLGLIERQSLDKWRFAHDKFRESIRASTNESDQKEIAFNLASFYNLKTEKSPDDVFALARLCAMAERADFVIPTISANLEAGKLSLANFAHSEGYKYLLFAFELLKQNKLDDRKLISQITSKLAICATMIADWKIANECSQIYYKMSDSKEQIFDSQVLRAWVLKNQGDSAGAWDFFRLACDTSDRPYPWYLQWKLLEILCCGFVIYMCDLLRIKRLPKAEDDRQKNMDLVSLYYEGNSCAEYLNKMVDVALIASKLILKGRQSNDQTAVALGYAGMCYFIKNFGPQDLVNVFGQKATDLCPHISDRTVVAKIDYIVFISKVQAGIIRLADADLLEKLDQAKNNLPTVEYGSLLFTCGWFYMIHGHFDIGLSLVQKGLSDHDNFIKRVGMHNRVVGLGHQWLFLNCLGKIQEAQAAKKVFVDLNSQMRFVPTVNRMAIMFETLNYHYMDMTDSRTFELMEIAFNRLPLLINYSAYKFNESILCWLCLEMLEKATNPDTIYSLSRKFKRGMMRLFLTSYSTEMKINYYYLLARHSTYQRNSARSGKLYDQAEKIAFKFQNARLLFDIYRDKARAALQANDLFGLNLHLGKAFQVALQNGWQPLLDNLKFEFDHHFEKLRAQEFVNGSVDSSTRLHKTTVQTSSRSNLTHGPNSSQLTVQGRNSTVTGSRGNAKVDISEMRFVDALLNVSTAFVNSIDLVEQSGSVLTEIVKLFAAERGFVFFKDDGESELKALAGKSFDGSTVLEIKGFSSTVIKKVMSTGEPIIVTGTDEGEILGSESAVLHNLRSIMATPLKVKDTILGVVYVDSSLTKGLFTNNDIELFSTLANHISVAFELSRMTKVELEKASLRRELEVQTVAATESKKVKVLVDNIQQAVFSVAAGGTILEPISKYTENIFKRDVVGENVMAVLFKDLSDQKEQYDIVNSSIATVFGEDELQWILMRDYIPRKIRHRGTKDHTLKIMASPIWDDLSRLEKILFVVEDVTDFEILEQQVQEQRIQASMLEEIFSGNAEDTSEFFKDASTLLASLEKTDYSNGKETLTNLLRELHTLKGNARLFGFRRLSDQIHTSESALLALAQVSEPNEDQRKLIVAELTLIIERLAEYESLVRRVYAARTSNASSAAVSDSTVQNLIGLVESFESDPSNTQSTRLKRAIKRLSYRSLGDVAQRFDGMIKDISTQLGKNVQLKVVGDAFIEAESLTLLKESLLHLLRNSLDHGIEDNETRSKMNKSAVGTITISCQDDLDSITLRIADDGSGMDPERIVNKAIERGIVNKSDVATLSQQDKINLIFMNGFSTKDSATDISGRGIGMDVVKLNVEKLGGAIHVETVKGAGSTFTIVIRRPDVGLVRLAAPAV